MRGIEKQRRVEKKAKKAGGDQVAMETGIWSIIISSIKSTKR